MTDHWSCATASKWPASPTSGPINWRLPASKSFSKKTQQNQRWTNTNPHMLSRVLVGSVNTIRFQLLKLFWSNQHPPVAAAGRSCGGSVSGFVIKTTWFIFNSGQANGDFSPCHSAHVAKLNRGTGGWNVQSWYLLSKLVNWPHITDLCGDESHHHISYHLCCTVHCNATLTWGVVRWRLWDCFTGPRPS